MQTNILEYLEHAEHEFPDRIAYVCGDERITFAELGMRAKRLGSRLCALTPPGRPIIVLSGKNLMTPVIYFGIVYAGCFYVPMSEDLPVIRMRHILEITEPEMIVTDGAHTGILDSVEHTCSILSSSQLLGEEIDTVRLSARRRRHLGTDPLYVIFTSGSSGKPKGVVTSHQSVINYIDVFTETFNICRDDILGNQAPLDYIAAIRDLYIPLKTGARCVFIPKSLYSTPLKLFTYLNEHRVTTLCWVAAALSLCAELNTFDYIGLHSVNKVFFTGSVMPCKHLKVWQKNLPDSLFANHYGPTEVTASCTYHIVESPVDDTDVLPIGVPFKNMDVLLLTEENKAPDASEIGEICVRGVGLALGYYGAPEKTEQSFTLNPLQPIFGERIYRTGDLGSYLPDGNLAFHGRKDFQIKHMGHRVELSEIEQTCLAMPEIACCQCLYKQEKEQIFLFYVGASDAKEIATFLRSHLPAYMIPRKFIQLDALPSNFNGKPDVEAMKKMMREIL